MQYTKRKVDIMNRKILFIFSSTKAFSL